MQKRWVIVSVAGAALAAGMFFTLRGGDGKTKKSEAVTPFRVGKVQAEDLQVSVREVGVVDPLVKVDVKSAVSAASWG